MTKKNYLIIVAFVLSVNSFSQVEDTIKKKEWIIKWNKTAAIDGASFPTVQFAIEKKINNYFSLQTEFGVQVYDLGKSDTTIVKASGFRSVAEARLYPLYFLRKAKAKNKKHNNHPYIGLQGFYRQNKYTSSNYYYIPVPGNDEGIRFSDYFGVNKKAYGAGVVIGLQLCLGNHFIMEPYIQFGYIYRDIKNTDRDYNFIYNRFKDNGNHDFFGGYDEEEDSGDSENFSLGFRLGYRF